MKRGLLLTIGLVFLTVMTLTAIAADKDTAQWKPKGKEVTKTGMFSCAFCKMAHPDKTCTKECCQGCIKAGSPQMLTDADGNMYILMNAEMKQPLMNAEREEMLGGKVKVKGLMVKGKGIQAIYVESMEKAADVEKMGKEKMEGMAKEAKEKATE